MWTPLALASEHRALSGDAWRVVESQSRYATMKIVDDVGEQEILEAELERTKPAMPEGCGHLHWLLATPFRYAPYPNASRFRRARQTDGCLYASERIETAVAEDGFYRLLFFLDAPTMIRPKNPQERTAFRLRYVTAAGLDLTHDPFQADSAVWSHPTDYGPCQDFADAARTSDAQAIRYTSVRDPSGGANLALLSWEALDCGEPLGLQTWHVMFRTDRLEAFCEMPRRRLTFRLADWAATDSRIPTHLP